MSPLLPTLRRSLHFLYPVTAWSELLSALTWTIESWSPFLLLSRVTYSFLTHSWSNLNFFLREKERAGQGQRERENQRLREREGERELGRERERENQRERERERDRGGGRGRARILSRLRAQHRT